MIRNVRSIVFAAALVAAVVPSALQAQTAPSPAAATTEADEKAVHDVIVRLFDGMRARDTVMMKSVLSDNAMMFGLDREGNVTANGISGWIQSVAGAPAGVKLDEVLHDVEVRIDGNLAAVWTYYDFFVGENFSHCGYDAFTLLKTPQGWKIAAVADSRRRNDCRQKRS